ncbi:Aspartate aminotransferase, mitochondrial [Zancudomyces culisetae]|uniref:Aspartate aminotransferase n=1 Tax=Zancudomyces culisetae TaxID=1213189 RepID=A0A1R1PKX2_ZANCU|nr:Aspartate aminotransferase, mitochondrial [Zancudomyces culisetae]|eukprot:OMH81573.1 Aspartate aminotransferase, mitochondrial [Zancudomyces culisetae]
MISNTTRIAGKSIFKAPAGVRFNSIWANIKMGPPDPILGINEAFKKDSHPLKVNLGVGAFRDDNGKPKVLDCVRKAEKIISEKNLDKEYIPIVGLPQFNSEALKLAYGENSSALKEDRVAVTQTLSGTGALRIGGAFIERFLGKDTTVYVPGPTWGNHISVFKDCGLQPKEYRYYDKKTNGLDIAGLLEDLSSAKPGSVALLHGCAHNPTGVDPTFEQWKQILEVCKKNSIIPFFDVAYQGFASGDTNFDAQSLRLFVDSGVSIMLSQSFAKNMGLYGERVGTFSVVCASSEEKDRVLSQFKILIRPIYSSPPVNGARIAAEVLSNPELNKLWLTEVKGMADRIISMRSLLRKHLEEDCKSSLSWKHITDQIGMFCFTGISPEAVDRLKDEFHIYLTRNGRISMAGITTKNVRYVAESFHEVTK